VFASLVSGCLAATKLQVSVGRVNLMKAHFQKVTLTKPTKGSKKEK
jgi:hypothetical protein